MDSQACFDEWLSLMGSEPVRVYDADVTDRIDELVDAYDRWVRMGGFLAQHLGVEVESLTTAGNMLLLSPSVGAEWVSVWRYVR